MSDNLLAHQFNVPHFFGVVAIVLFAISAQVPVADNFPLSEWKFVPLCGTNKGMLSSTELTVTDLFATLL